MRHFIVTVVAALAFGLLTPSPVLADPPIGSLIDRGGKGLTKRFNPRHESSARPALNVYFRCRAALDRSAATQVIDLPFRSAEQIELIERVVRRGSFGMDRREDCFSNFGDVQIGYDPASVIGGFAEFLVTARYDDRDVARIASLSVDDWRSPGLVPRNGSEMIGLCVAQASGRSVLELIETEPETAAEAAAIQKIIPFLGPCLTEGVEVSFDATSLRALLAHGLHKALSQMTELEQAS